jgi:hypothetical protein
MIPKGDEIRLQLLQTYPAYLFSRNWTILGRFIENKFQFTGDWFEEQAEQQQGDCQ